LVAELLGWGDRRWFVLGPETDEDDPRAWTTELNPKVSYRPISWIKPEEVELLIRKGFICWENENSKRILIVLIRPERKQKPLSWRSRERPRDFVRAQWSAIAAGPGSGAEH
jgi:hypothetical protein